MLTLSYMRQRKQREKAMLDEEFSFRFYAAEDLIFWQFVVIIISRLFCFCHLLTWSNARSSCSLTKLIDSGNGKIAFARSQILFNCVCVFAICVFVKFSESCYGLQRFCDWICTCESHLQRTHNDKLQKGRRITSEIVFYERVNLIMGHANGAWRMCAKLWVPTSCIHFPLALTVRVDGWFAERLCILAHASIAMCVL